MTALGIGLTVAVLVADLALVNGLKEAFRTTGNPLDVLVLRKGGTAELSSSISREVYQDLKADPGIARNRAGEPLASLEMVAVISLAGIDSPNGMSVSLRGLSDIGREMRAVRIVEGRWYRPGRREVVAGKSVARRYPQVRIGNRIRFGKGEMGSGRRDGRGLFGVQQRDLGRPEPDRRGFQPAGGCQFRAAARRGRGIGPGADPYPQ